ncbi:MAG: acyl-CoA dehydrogenase [Deltaproteobacteria bacterium]|nr:acyl-CoA dehydrogenase family protein [Deltaproteobacteria bacterium]MBW2403867.1 acyl-CoA dehydrogenase family protein [Deltaproteobacteria bacterium]RLB48629.1 MAG: acyl-CoA dehydrogenase [Deltaproteobacteria bacterium]
MPGCYLPAVGETGPELLDVLGAGAEAEPERDLGWVWSAYQAARDAGAAPFAAAVLTASRVDRLGLAFAAGYPAALQQLSPGTRLPCALCVTEDEGTHPRAMKTTLERVGGRDELNGTKTFVTFGNLAKDLLVAAKVGEKPDGRPDLALVRIPADRAGVTLEVHPPTPFAPEIPHARLELRHVQVRAGERLPGDGFTEYVKPFRTVEDIHVLGAALGYLVGVTRRANGPVQLLADFGAALVALDWLRGVPPLDPRTHVVLQGVYQRVVELAEGDELAAVWESTSEDERDRWRRDRPLLDVAFRARRARFERATRELS